MFCYSNNRIYCNKYVVPLKISFLQEKNHTIWKCRHANMQILRTEDTNQEKHLDDKRHSYTVLVGPRSEIRHI